MTTSGSELRDAEQPYYVPLRDENCPPGFKTGDQIAPPNGYVGGGLQMQTDIAVSPSGDVWAMNNWQDIDSCFGVPDEALQPVAGTGRNDLLRHGQAGTRAADRPGTRILTVRSNHSLPRNGDRARSTWWSNGLYLVSKTCGPASFTFAFASN